MASDRGVFHTKIKQEKFFFSFGTSVLHIFPETKRVILTMQNEKRIQALRAKP
jgi:hypothetical protein